MPDFLSRNPDDAQNTNDSRPEIDILPPTITENPAEIRTLADEVREAQRGNEPTQPSVQDLDSFQHNAPTLDWQRRLERTYEVHDGYLLRKDDHAAYTPKGIRGRVLRDYHGSILAGHPGAEETERSIRAKFYWPKMKRDIRYYVRGCPICTFYKRHPNYPRAPQRPRQPRRPFETLTLDLMGPYPETPQGNRYVVVITDLYSRWGEAFPVPNTSTYQLINLMDQQLFPRFGYPMSLITDNGCQFTSQAWAAPCRRWRRNLWITATYINPGKILPKGEIRK